MYIIEVRIGPYCWTVKHRYSEFFDLHEKVLFLLSHPLSISYLFWTDRHFPMLGHIRVTNFLFHLVLQMVIQYKLDKNLLPPKKLFGNQSESFIKKRQGELEIYLQTVLHHLTGIPPHLSSFLNFHKYVSHKYWRGLVQSDLVNPDFTHPNTLTSSPYSWEQAGVSPI